MSFARQSFYRCRCKYEYHIKFKASVSMTKSGGE